MEPIRVTCCIVTYNSQAHIARAIQSLLQYTKGVHLQIYVVDNASTDDTVKIVQETFPKEQYPQITLLQNATNLGLTAANNLLLERLDSKYHVILNPDIEIRSDVVSHMANYLESHRNIGLLSPRVLNPDGTEQPLPKREPRIKYLLANRLLFPGSKRLATEYAMRDCDLSKPIDIGMATGCFMFLRTKLFRQIGGFDEGYFLYFEDADLTRRLRRISRAVYYPYAEVFHDWARESARNPRLMLIHIRSMFRFFAEGKKLRKE